MKLRAFNHTYYSYIFPLLTTAKNPQFILLLLYTFILLRTAWNCDDAYITFRTIDNFVNGYGLTWNIAERVQAYTNPLWMFLLTGFYFFSHEIYFTSLFISITISLIVFYILIFKCPVNNLSGVLAALILIFSKAFVDYSTSGLENPLTNLIIILFFLTLLKKEIRPQTILVLSCLAGLGCFNRIDTILIFFPALLYAAFKLNNYRKAVFILIIGFIPFLMWELFALFYYGFPFPNTAYAKLNTGISWIALLKHGIKYLYHSIKTDPITLITITVGCVIVLLKRNTVLKVIFLGSMIYILYIVKIGGDFMSGRFFTAPLVATVIIITQLQFNGKYFKFILPALIIIIGILSPHPPLFSDSEYGNKERPKENYWMDVCDERAFYYQNFGLLNQIRYSRLAYAPSVIIGKELREKADKVGSLIIVRGQVGFSGYFAGPKVHIVDYCALSDPLLARLPPIKTSKWRIGHFRRSIPPGYLETLKTGQMQINDKNIVSYYKVLHTIISGDLFSFQRLKEIIKINCGIYNSLIDRAFWENPPQSDELKLKFPFSEQRE